MKTVYSGVVFRVESGVVREPGGVRARRDVVRHSGSVAVLPVHDDGSVTLVRQYRCAFRTSLLELPAGRIDAGERPRAAARRELREEIGLDARSLSKLVRLIPSPGFLDETVTIFRATGLYPASATPDPDERITLVRLPFARALALVERGRIQDAKSLAALLLEARRRA